MSNWTYAEFTAFENILTHRNKCARKSAVPYCTSFTNHAKLLWLKFGKNGRFVENFVTNFGEKGSTERFVASETEIKWIRIKKIRMKLEMLFQTLELERSLLVYSKRDANVLERSGRTLTDLAVVVNISLMRFCLNTSFFSINLLCSQSGCAIRGTGLATCQHSNQKTVIKEDLATSQHWNRS